MGDIETLEKFHNIFQKYIPSYIRPPSLPNTKLGQGVLIIPQETVLRIFAQSDSEQQRIFQNMQAQFEKEYSNPQLDAVSVSFKDDSLRVTVIGDPKVTSQNIWISTLVLDKND